MFWRIKIIWLTILKVALGYFVWRRIVSSKLGQLYNHRIIATPAQIAAAQATKLRMLMLAYPKELLMREGRWDYHEWIRDEPTTCPYEKSDRIFLAEEWCKENWGAAFDDCIYFAKSTTPEAEHIGWQPASTMPPEAAQYWFSIEHVQVTQMLNIDPEIALRSGVTSISCNTEFERWEAAHPDCFWVSEL